MFNVAPSARTAFGAVSLRSEVAELVSINIRSPEASFSAFAIAGLMRRVPLPLARYLKRQAAALSLQRPFRRVHL